jgi:hypothetical protein
MPTKKTSGATAKKRTPAAKKSAPRKRAAKAIAAAAAAGATPVAAPRPSAPAAPTCDRLIEAAKTIGSTMGEIVAKAKHALHREPENN